MEDIKIRSLREKQKEKLEKAENFFQKKMDMQEIPPEKMKKKNRHLVKRLSKFIALTAFIFIIGGLGGVWIDRIALPTITVRYPELNQYDFLKRLNERTTIVRETQEIRISQEEATSSAVEKTQATVVEIRTKNNQGVYTSIGTGIILTSDGYIITPLKNIFIGEAINQDIQVKFKNGKTYPAQISAQNQNYSLAILKISENNLPVIPYADMADVKLGQKLIILDNRIVTDIVSRIIEEYKMPGSTDSAFQKRIQIVQNLGTDFAGAAIISLDGRLVGVGQDADIIIPISEIREFIEKSTGK